MCPTLEQILSRSLMRGKIPFRSTTNSNKISELSPSEIPSLKVPQAKPANIHQSRLDTATTKTTTGTSNVSGKTSSSSSSANQQQQYISQQDAVIAAFSGLSTPHFTPDPREKIRERPERGGLRSLQDLPTLMQNCVVLNEWESALAALAKALELAIVNHSTFPIRKTIALDHFVAAARLCKTNLKKNEFENFMEKMIKLYSAEGKSDAKKNKAANENNNINSSSQHQQNFAEQLSEITTEVLVEVGSWEQALLRFETLCKEGRETVGSLNACITACGIGKQWELALRLAAPALRARSNQFLEEATLKTENEKSSTSRPEDENSALAIDDPSTVVPLSRFGSQQQDQSQQNQNQEHQQQTNEKAVSSASSENSKVVANAVTYAQLVATLENCGKAAESAKILKSAPQADREVVLTSYVALLSVWSESHGKKSMRRF